jgi:hypothetical protein
MRNREEWRHVLGFEWYWVSNLGHVRRDGKMLKPQSGRGYWHVSLSLRGKRYTKRIHRLVAQAFIPNPRNLPEVNHKRGNTANNRVSNLEWSTTLANRRHAAKHQLLADGVTYDKSRDRWMAWYSPEPYQRVWLGRFKTKREAKRVRDKAIATLKD